MWPHKTELGSLGPSNREGTSSLAQGKSFLLSNNEVHPKLMSFLLLEVLKERLDESWWDFEMAFASMDLLEFEMNHSSCISLYDNGSGHGHQGSCPCYCFQNVRAATLFFSDFCLPGSEIAKCSLVDGKLAQPSPPTDQ